MLTGTKAGTIKYDCQSFFDILPKMKKQIIHFGQDPDRAEFYNLILKVSDIRSVIFAEKIRQELFYNEFAIYHFDENTIEAGYKNNYLKVCTKYRQLIDNGWRVFKNFTLIQYNLF